MGFDISRLRSSERIVGVGVVALFILMFFFKWFGVDISGAGAAFLRVAGVSTSADAWHTMSGIRWILLLTVLAGAGAVMLAGTGRKLEMPVSVSVIVAGLGAVATIFVFYRAIISHPDSGESTKIGAYLGIVVCAAITYGGYLGMQADGTSIADVRAQASDALGNLSATASQANPPAATVAGGASEAYSPPIPSPAAPPDPAPDTPSA